MKALFKGNVSMHHWGEKQRSFGGESNNAPCVLDMGIILGVYGNIVLHTHEEWKAPMFTDFTNASEWVLVEGEG